MPVTRPAEPRSQRLRGRGRPYVSIFVISVRRQTPRARRYANDQRRRRLRQGLVTHDVARPTSALSEDGKDISTLAIKRVTRLATFSPTTADETALASLRVRYEAAISYPDGVAIAYVYCATFSDVAN